MKCVIHLDVYCIAWDEKKTIGEECRKECREQICRERRMEKKRSDEDKNLLRVD